MEKTVQFFTILILIFLFSCQTKIGNNDIESTLTSSDSTNIIDGVITATELFAEANNNLDGKKVTEFWQSSPNFKFIEKPNIYQNWDTIYKYTMEFYDMPIDSINLEWKEREIIPLTKEFAYFYGKYELFIRFTPGEIMHGIPFYTALMVKENDQWKVLQGHESFVLIEH